MWCVCCVCRGVCVCAVEVAFVAGEGGGRKVVVMCGCYEHPVVAMKAFRVGDFNGKNLSSIGSSTILVDPDRLEARQLKAW